MTEKGDLLDRNADLLQELHKVKASNSESKLELQRTLDLKSSTVDNLQRTETELREKLQTLEAQVCFEWLYIKLSMLIT